VPDMATQSVQYEPVAWWWTRNQIGRELRERYEVPEELPPKLVTLVSKLDLSLPKTLFKLTRGLRRNQNIIAA
jgi:hypothetical protein